MKRIAAQIRQNMANLIVRDIDESLVRALKQRAAKHGRSAEAEHWQILASVLRRPCQRHLAEVLVAVPKVGRKEDFERVEDGIEARYSLGSVRDVDKP